MTHAPTPSSGTPPPTGPAPPRPAAPASSWVPRTAGVIWWLPLLIAAIGGVVAYVLSDMRELSYESRAALLAPEEGEIAPEELVALVDQDAVYVATIRTLQLDDSVSELHERIDVSNTGVVIEFVARAPGAGEARALARTFSTEARDPRVTESGTLLTVHLQASTPARPLNDDTARNTAAAVAGGLVLGALLALVFAGGERASRHRLDVAAITGWPVLATIPHRALADGPLLDGDALAPYHRLQEAIDAQRLARGFLTLLVVGVEDGDGATTVATNLALASARAGVETTLVDADFADPAVHRALGIDNTRGLTDSLEAMPTPAGWFASDTPAYAALALHSLGPRRASMGGTGRAIRLHTLTSGPQPDSPRAVLESRRLGEILLELGNDASLTIVNGPPLEPDAGARSLLRQCDATVVVANALTGDPQRVADAAAALGAGKSRVIGVVVTRTLERDQPAQPGPRRVERPGSRVVVARSATPFAATAPASAASSPTQPPPDDTAPRPPARPPMGWPPAEVPGASRPREIPPRPPDG